MDPGDLAIAIVLHLMALTLLLGLLSAVVLLAVRVAGRLDRRGMPAAGWFVRAVIPLGIVALSKLNIREPFVVPGGWVDTFVNSLGFQVALLVAFAVCVSRGIELGRETHEVPPSWLARCLRIVGITLMLGSLAHGIPWLMQSVKREARSQGIAVVQGDTEVTGRLEHLPGHTPALQGNTSLSGTGQFYAVAQSRWDGTKVVDQSIDVFHFDTGMLDRRFEFETNGGHTQVFFDHAGRRVGMAQDSDVRIWDMASGNLALERSGLRWGSRRWEFGPDEQTVIAFGNQFEPNRAILVENGIEVAVPWTCLTSNQLEHFVVDRSRRQVAIGLRSPAVEFWQIDGEVPAWTVTASDSPAGHWTFPRTHLAFDMEGELLASGDSREITIRRTSDGSVVGRVHVPDVRGLAFMTRGADSILNVVSQTTIHTFDAASFRKIAEYDLSVNVLNSGSRNFPAWFGDDGRLLLESYAYGISCVTRWNLAAGIDRQPP